MQRLGLKKDFIDFGLNPDLQACSPEDMGLMNPDLGATIKVLTTALVI